MSVVLLTLSSASHGAHTLCKTEKNMSHNNVQHERLLQYVSIRDVSQVSHLQCLASRICVGSSEAPGGTPESCRQDKEKPPCLEDGSHSDDRTSEMNLQSDAAGRRSWKQSHDHRERGAMVSRSAAAAITQVHIQSMMDG